MFNGKAIAVVLQATRLPIVSRIPRLQAKNLNGTRRDWRRESNISETSLTNQDTEQEMILTSCEIGFPKTLEILQDQNVSIANTGASVDSTRHQKGCINPFVHTFFLNCFDCKMIYKITNTN